MSIVSTAAAYHEAGHVVVILHYRNLQFSITRDIEIDRINGGGNTPWFDNSHRQSAYEAVRETEKLALLRPVLHVMFAGGYAEVKKTGNGAAANIGVRQDVKEIMETFQAVFPTWGKQKVMQEMSDIDQQARALIDQYWDKVEAIAILLIQTGRISAASALQIFTGAIAQAQNNHSSQALYASKADLNETSIWAKLLSFLRCKR